MWLQSLYQNMQSWEVKWHHLVGTYLTIKVAKRLFKKGDHMSGQPVVPAAPSFKSLEDLVGLVSKMASAIIAAPKPLSVSDLTVLLPLFPQIEQVLGELGDIPTELGEMNYAEGSALVAIVAANLSVADAKAIAVINASLQLISSGIALVKAVKA